MYKLMAVAVWLLVGTLGSAALAQQRAADPAGSARAREEVQQGRELLEQANRAAADDPERLKLLEAAQSSFDSALRTDPESLEALILQAQLRRALLPHQWKTRQTVTMGLTWLADQRHADGGWAFTAGAAREGRFDNPGTDRSRCRATALAMAALLGSGDTPTRGLFALHLQSGLHFLLSEMKTGPNGGDLRGPDGDMEAHALATLVLCEIVRTYPAETWHGVSLRSLQVVAIAAVEFLEASQHKDGGWGKQPGERGDVVVTAWALMALTAARSAGLRVSPDGPASAARFLDSVQSDGGAYYGRTEAGKEPTATAAGLVSRMLLGADPQSPAILRGLKYLIDVEPAPNDIEFTFFGNLAARRGGGESWRIWNRRVRMLPDAAIANDRTASWFNAADPRAKAGGRLYQTAMRVLVMTTYYGHLSVFNERATLAGQ